MKTTWGKIIAGHTFNLIHKISRRGQKQKRLLSADLFVQNVSILHIVTDEESRTHYQGFDADPVQRKHERVELLDSQRPTETEKDRLDVGKITLSCQICHVYTGCAGMFFQRCYILRYDKYRKNA